jgi:hypothetical protein
MGVKTLLRLREKPTPRAYPSAPELPEALLETCRMLPSRAHLLDVLPKGGSVAEVGVASGKFSQQILDINQPQTLHLIDPWVEEKWRAGYERVVARFTTEIESGRVRIDRRLSTDALPEMPSGSLDWIYIDTVHDYSTTRQELDLAATVVKPDGYIAGHDFCAGNVRRGVEWGVMTAVAEFCLDRQWAFAYFTLAPRGAFSFCLFRSSIS